MAIKKQKRSLEEANLAPAQNGSGKKFQKPLKNIKTEKPQKGAGGAAPKKFQKPPKVNVKTEIENSPKKMKLVTGEQPAKKQKKEIEAAPASVGLTPAQETKKAEKLLKKNENRKIARKEKGQYDPMRITMKPEDIKKRIEEMQSRTDLTKTAKRKLGVLKKKLAIAEGTFVSKMPPKSDVPLTTKSTRRHERRKRQMERKLAARNSSDGLKPVDIQNFKKKTLEKQPNKTSAKAEVKKTENVVVKHEKLIKGEKKQQKAKELKKLPIKKEEPEISDDDDEEEEDSDEEMDDSSAEDLNATEEQSEDDDDEDDEDDDDDEEDEDDEDEDDEDDDMDKEEVKFAFPEKKIKQEIKKEPIVKKEFKKEQITNGDDGKKKRFVLFVGNLSFQATADDIKNHFLTKVTNVTSVRVPTKPGSNSPRGIAYVELTNEEDYQKALSLHNTTINGRRINVEYTQGGSKSVGNRSEIVSKNKKLHAMRKGGMLAGKRDNRNDRRQKARQQGPA